MMTVQFRRILTSSLSSLVLLGGLAVTSIPVLADSPVLLVDDDKKQCPTAQYAEIQVAVAAAPSGATIHVCPGTYTVPLTIIRPVKIVADTGSVLRPTTTATTTSLNDGSSIAALVLVSNTNGVSIDDLTVDGSDAMPTACAPDYTGVMYQNASGALTNMAIRNIKLLGDGLQGCQSGEGIWVQGKMGNHNVDISDSSVHDYQKTGILVDGAASNGNIKHNYVTGLGPTPDIAQNGIQVSRGASPTVTNNFVNNHIYTVCTSQLNCTYASTDILVYQANGISVKNNTVGSSQTSIAIVANNALVQNNDVYDNKIYEGIDLLGNNNRATSNNIFHSDSAGVFAMGTNNKVDTNTINEAYYGVLTQGSPNQVTGNQYFNVVVPTSSIPTTAALTLTSSIRTLPVSPH